MTPGQSKALDEAREIEAASESSVSLVTEPTDVEDYLRLDLSLDTSSLERVPEGLPLRDRERFIALVPADFPFAKPSVRTRHSRFAGQPHVQWSKYLCLYQAPDVEWDPGDGMFGFVDRLWKWLERGALDQLDPVGGALHPPTTASGSRHVVVPRLDTPPVGTTPWTGLARLRLVDDYRVDVVGWAEPCSDEPRGSSAAVVLLAEPMPWEFPRKAADLVRLLSDRGVPKEYLFLLLRAAVRENQEGEPLYVLIGTPMRGVRGSGDLRQHLTAWRIEPLFATGLGLIANKQSDNEALREIGEDVEQIMLGWAETAEVSWCRVLEDRPEIVTRRDHTSPLGALLGKSVAVWGCGALGGHVALHVARAGAARVVLRDNATVTPGVLVRQPYDDADVGRSKANALAEKLRAVRRSDPRFDVIPIVSNVLTTALDGDDWTDGTDIVFDCTASRAVRVKLEKVRKDNPAVRTDVVSMIVSGEATHGLAVVAASHHTGGPADVYRRAKLDVSADRSLRHFANAFYPTVSDDELFQPEPGCSSPTFIGSSADAAALTGLLLNSACPNVGSPEEADRKDDQPAAWAHFVAQPHGVPATGQRPHASFDYTPDIVTQDPRRGYEIRTSRRASHQMERWIARSRDAVGPDVETGGLSFGERNDAVGVIWVSDVIGPPPDSIARPNLFVCGTVGTLAAHHRREQWSRGSIVCVGMWHTHPNSAPVPSSTDLRGMAKIVAEGPVNPSRSLLTIVGTPYDDPLLGTFVFDRDDIRTARSESYRFVQVTHVPRRARNPNLGLALSGGGSRAIAFHLGCLRALNDRGILDEVGVMSAVSGGAVLAAMYAYSDDEFDLFEERVLALLRRGLQFDLATATLNPVRVAHSAITTLVAGVAAAGAQLLHGAVRLGHDLFRRSSRATRPDVLTRISPPFQRWASRTTAFEATLRARLFGDTLLRESLRPGLDIVLNATELRTGTAFRFGSRTSASSRFGSVQEDVAVATAVAASAAYPLFLPALHKRYAFEHEGTLTNERIVLADGGVYDNLGATCLDPTRDPDFTAHVYPCDRLICCNAGHGQWDRAPVPYGWPSRMRRTTEAMFRKGQDRTMGNLFAQRAAGVLKGLILPYLGMKDESLHRDPAVGSLPDDFVFRNQVIGYPTDFRAMKEIDLDRITRRGEQLTHLLIDAYWC